MILLPRRDGDTGLAVDGQAGCILRAYREHQMSADDAFLKSLWPKVKLAMQCLVRMDNGEGILEGAQHNTLDALVRQDRLAQLALCGRRSGLRGNGPGSGRRRLCRTRCGGSSSGAARTSIASCSTANTTIQIPDTEHAKAVGSHDGCEIDQVFGQSWACQVGLGRILDEENVKTGAGSLWQYNFTPDVGPFRESNKRGRWYAMAGEGGLLMCSWPKGDAARVHKPGYDYRTSTSA